MTCAAGRMPVSRVIPRLISRKQSAHVRDVQGVLEHPDIMTIRIYAHAKPARLRSTMETLYNSYANRSSDAAGFMPSHKLQAAGNDNR